MFNRVVMISGAPRSGTSWVGQVLDSSPITAYRFQPLFAKAFKDFLDIHSDRNNYFDFFKRVYDSADDFLLQTERRNSGIYPVFKNKLPKPEILAIKMVRYHFLLPKMLQFFNDTLKIICVLRHPCGAINSWINTPKEFHTDADPLKEWNLAAFRNKGKPEEYWGYDGWKRATDIFINIKQQFDDKVYFLIYEKMVSNTENAVENLFDFLDLPLSKQTVDFIKASNQVNNDDPYSVYKDKRVMDKWKKELDPVIKENIIRKATRHYSKLLEQFE
ncbi:sulfotransferase [Thermodesulfobacteriota bacterium]